MTDLTAIIEMLKWAGIEYELAEDPANCETEELSRTEKVIVLIVYGGYSGFYSQFTFSAESGKLLQLEAYE